MRPAPNDYAPYYHRYISLVEESDPLTALEKQSSDTQRALAGLDESRGSYRYAEGKWSVKEVFGHVIDAERVFAYRALSFARGEKSPLPSFDEEDWSRFGGWDRWKVSDLAEEYALMRRSNIVLFRNLPPEAWERRGVASDNEVTVNALLWIIVGHEKHHLSVLRERYHV